MFTPLIRGMSGSSCASAIRKSARRKSAPACVRTDRQRDRLDRLVRDVLGKASGEFAVTIVENVAEAIERDRNSLSVKRIAVDRIAIRYAIVLLIRQATAQQFGPKPTNVAKLAQMTAAERTDAINAQLALDFEANVGFPTERRRTR